MPNLENNYGRIINLKYRIKKDKANCKALKKLRNSKKRVIEKGVIEKRGIKLTMDEFNEIMSAANKVHFPF